MVFIPPFIPQLLPVSSQLRGIKWPYRMARLTHTQCSILNSHSPARYCQARNIRRTGDGFSVFLRYSLLASPVSVSLELWESLLTTAERRRSLFPRYWKPAGVSGGDLYIYDCFFLLFLFRKKVYCMDYRIPSHMLSKGFMC